MTPFVLKTLSKDAIPAALEKAERYRLLGEPQEAESICRDILDIDPNNQDAQIALLLAITDEFKHQLTPAFTRAKEVLEQLGDAYCKDYYGGILCERRAKAHLQSGGPSSGHMAYEWFRKAMDLYESALTTCSPGNQSALLRWNTCARIINENPGIAPAPDDRTEPMLDAAPDQT
ncbi:hypothetical protein D3OALGB2SA_1068 [Olavius algarvensis associated proteobacterium Delta 3]|nr:hypothetical protein D3OALGB2SA_1068 [Olavius algarvensis associated proteobacterium Delta 3]